MEKYKIDLNIQADIVIVGTGVSGLYAALNLPHDKKNRYDYQVRS